jgi:hypothetical protein
LSMLVKSLLTTLTGDTAAPNAVCKSANAQTLCKICILLCEFAHNKETKIQNNERKYNLDFSTIMPGIVTIVTIVIDKRMLLN